MTTQIIDDKRIILYMVNNFDLLHSVIHFPCFANFAFYCSNKRYPKTHFFLFFSFLEAVHYCTRYIDREIRNAFDSVEIKCHHKSIHVERASLMLYVFTLRVKVYETRIRKVFNTEYDLRDTSFRKHCAESQHVYGRVIDEL